ncbi:YggS family pyridoxal phosphate-dependent enzyme [Bacteroidetes bacterium endosymbiont of Geopemphigus sp.]|uniref:YggS family pyridoxal phosphate-dependent enzyme n=1 Tax=Bacteroidetes bacterium endosymbiont of Geopemphigus sp. TaxID=2047937 RepID=UPI000CD0F785|nr:YggS family pyridoxal phosphate-dependent enzyme [Bacteroidetes bacterium endosymbiont of Geopemphigus sp.]
MNVSSNLKEIRAEIGSKIQLIAVSKKQTLSSIIALYDEGQRDFGENYIQELTEKYQKLPRDIRWHMIGKIQSNKLKYIAPFIYMVHSIEKLSHLQTLEKEAAKHARIIRCLLQVKIARESSKSGMTTKQVRDLIDAFEYCSMPHIQLSGLMGIASFTEDQQKVCEEFNRLKKNFKELNKNDPNFKVLSMGMSSDYLLAIASGSTMVRIGSKLFGERTQ